MIVQEFLLDKYGWIVRVYYAVKGYNFEEIEEFLKELKASDKEVEEALEDFHQKKDDIGYIYSNLNQRKTAIVIGPTSSADEFQNTFDHEKGHLAMHICLADGIDPFSEQYQYLTGEIGKHMFKVGKLFLCDRCRKDWIK